MSLREGDSLGNAVAAYERTLEFGGGPPKPEDPVHRFNEHGAGFDNVARFEALQRGVRLPVDPVGSFVAAYRGRVFGVYGDMHDVDNSEGRPLGSDCNWRS